MRKKEMMPRQAGWRREFSEGVRDAVPIALGYFAVSFSLGIAAHMIGMTSVQGFFLSFLNNASAGEYAGISAIAEGTSLAALAVLILITNARYLLMSCALSQKLSPDVGILQRLVLAWGVTDELFGLGVSRNGYVQPSYLYGADVTALSCWAAGTVGGVIAGNVFPPDVVSALSASIFGMFLAVILPRGRKDRATLMVILSGFGLSGLFAAAPALNQISGNMRVILLTLVISAAAAVIRPVQEETAEAEIEQEKSEQKKPAREPLTARKTAGAA